MLQEQKEILAMNRFDPEQSSALAPDVYRHVARRKASFGASSVLFYAQPIEMVRARGAYMFDAHGRRYLDLYNNVASVGHSHPLVVEAVSRQLDILNTHTRYLNEGIEAYAEELLNTFPDPLANLIMTCTGSEANDLALRIAQRKTNAKGVIVTRAAYHGNTAAVAEISPAGLRNRLPADHVKVIDAPDSRLAIHGDAALHFEQSVSTAIRELNSSGVGFCALIVDSIFSSDGIFSDPAGFLQIAVQKVQQANGLFIADEVQPGFGRTGDAMWGFMRHGVIPDIVTLGKPMGNGFPMGGVVSRPELIQNFCEETGYFNTFAGSPVAAAAGSAVLKVLKEEGLIANAATVGAYLKKGLMTLKQRYPSVGDIRGTGLFIGLDLIDPKNASPDPNFAGRIINALKENGILIGAAGRFGHTLKIRPPLCFSKEDADVFLEALDMTLALHLR